MAAVPVFTPHLGRDVWLREGTSDSTVWADVFTGRYHLPPEDMPEPATVLDLGSNIGLTVAHYRHLWPKARIVGVEMDVENAELARRNAPGVLVRREAVVARPGDRFYDTSAAAFAYALGPSGQAVPSSTLRELVLREFGGPVDFAKMDVEGEEWNLFALPEWASLVRHLVVELHERSRRERSQLLGRAIRRLEAAGYQARYHPPHPTAVYAWR